MVGEFEEKLNEIDNQIRSRQEQINTAHQKTLQIIEQVLGGKTIAESLFLIKEGKNEDWYC